MKSDVESNVKCGIFGNIFFEKCVRKCEGEARN